MRPLHPIQRFQEWFEEARMLAGREHDWGAMCLSTADANGRPSSRIVLLKSVDERGFVFFTNKNSRKSQELKANSAAALCFYWTETGKQVRVEGLVEETGDAESDEYFAGRSRGSQVGAWASEQSTTLADRTDLIKRYEEFSAQFEGKPVPRPPHWGGWRLVPDRIEFWKNGAHRLHKREVFTRDKEGWVSVLLNP
jgi:pyridoxamine 5'-phosphate oxidase